MDNLIIESTVKTPEVKLNSNGFLEISGKSIPENSIAFYQPLYAWLDNYATNPAAKTELKISLEYFNTSSSKCLLDVLRKLDVLNKSGKSSVSVTWYYEDGDDDMLEAGDDYKSLVPLPFSFMKV
ncbi:MAG TPA: nuclear pore complex subunit [Bacteroidetes bacterium]|nr:nuclear pore complex subunit [Bacteroidota bacterium]